MHKPELLLPVGNVESFYAAVQGGADAVYLGLKLFNARGRAANFTNYQLLQIIDEAKKHNIKVYVTLNTVIKNNELGALIDVLAFLSRSGVSAVIIQDWGTFNLIKTLFNNIVVHASTQLGTHNSTGVQFAKKAGFERVILARELTFNELLQIQKIKNTQTEVFIHGALCYSFSGMCHFSSFMGGAGANRGLCTQPCRRLYNAGNNLTTAFSLKDNQQVNLISEFTKLGVTSLKVEGRLKSPRYVYKVATAYKSIIDNKIDINNAVKQLSLDLTREKTNWFYGKQVNNAIAQKPITGLFVGTIISVANNYFIIKSSTGLKINYKLRVLSHYDNPQNTFKIESIENIEHNLVKVFANFETLKPGDEIYLADTNDIKFIDKLKNQVNNNSYILPEKIKTKALRDIRNFVNAPRQILFLRVNNIDWLNNTDIINYNYLIINLNKTNWPKLSKQNNKLVKIINKVWVELPYFIPEKDIAFYKNECKRLLNIGIAGFSLSHLSQKDIIPPNARFGTNENVYCFNDAAANYFANQGASWSISPFENDYDNLLSGANRNVIIPVYYYPRLFYSRQPVNSINKTFSDDTKNIFVKHIINGITIILPQNPVSITQYKQKLANKGFNLFVIDLSFENVDRQKLTDIFKAFAQSEKLLFKTSLFNFKRGLK